MSYELDYESRSRENVVRKNKSKKTDDMEKDKLDKTYGNEFVRNTQGWLV